LDGNPADEPRGFPEGGTSASLDLFPQSRESCVSALPVAQGEALGPQSIAASGNEPFKIQVVFQGGGARLCALMAVAEVLQEFATPKQNEPARISIGRLAGTSAGAIAAVMLATPKKSLAEFRKTAKEVGLKYLVELKPASWWNYVRVVRGYSLYDRNLLLKCFHELFRDGAPTVNDLRPQTEIYYTNIYSLRSQKAGQDEAVASALAKSCRIPVAFAGFNSDNHDVDGGLALNLPVDNILAAESTTGRVIGISFKSESEPPAATNIIGYVKHLFGAAVQTNVNRSVSQIGGKNVFTIRTDIGTFDFAAALDRGLGVEYDNIKYQFRDWLIQWLNDARPPFSGAQRFIRPSLSSSPLPASVIRELEDRFRSEPFTHGEVVGAYDVALLDGEGNFTGRYRSKVYNRIRIKKRTNILTFDFQTGKSGAKFSDSKFGFMVVDKNLTPLKFSGHVQERTLEADVLRSFRLFLFFDETLIPEAQNQPYAIELQYEVDDPFPGLAAHGDGLTLTRPSGGADSMTVAAAFPRKILPLNHRIVDMATLSPDEMKRVNYDPDPTDILVPSQEASQIDLLTHMDLEHLPEMYVIVGRILLNAEQGACFGFALRNS
jgi:predicted acylesterase/phospholipase RssA